jgi:hypothetical protein
MPRVRALSPRTIEAYRISLECFVSFLIDEKRLNRKNISFVHLERSMLKQWLAWMRETKHSLPAQNRQLTADCDHRIPGFRSSGRPDPRRPPRHREGLEGTDGTTQTDRIP